MRDHQRELRTAYCVILNSEPRATLYQSRFTFHASRFPPMLENIIFILYQPQDVVNVGGVARAMSNFGLRRLRLVEPAAFDAGRVAGIAHQAEAVIAGIERYPD